MKVKSLIEKLKGLDENVDIRVSSDEELNTIFKRFDITECLAEDEAPRRYVIFGFSGSEEEYY